MKTRSLFLACSTSCFALSSFVIVYLHSYPTIVNPSVSDLVLTCALAAWIGSITLAILTHESNRECALALATIVELSLVVRLIPHLRFSVPILIDPYPYSLVASSISTSGSLSPILTWWYPQLPNLMPWPLMQLQSVSVADASGLGLGWAIRFQEPLFGSLIAPAAFLLARSITLSNRASLLTALLASSSDVVIFYQSEYHPQGLALLLFTFFLYSYFRSLGKSKVPFRFISVILTIAMVFVHHFSAILVALLALGFLILAYLVPIIKARFPNGETAWFSASSRTVWLLLAVSTMSYEILGYPRVVRGFFDLLQYLPPPSIVITFGANTPLSSTILNALKWGVFVSAASVVIRMRHRLSLREWSLVMLILIVIAGGLLADFAIGGPTDRIVAFAILLVTPLSALGFLSVIGKGGPRVLWRVLTVAVLVVISTGGVMNVFPPGLYLQSSGPDPHYFSSNDFSSVSVYVPTGNWINQYTASDARYVVEFDAWMAVFYYGNRSMADIQWMGEATSNPLTDNPGVFLVVNPSVPYRYTKFSFDKGAFLAANDVVYSNGLVVVCTELHP